jgi:hypothetical protein
MSCHGIAVERFALEYKDMSRLLVDFRKYLEREHGQPVQCLEVNASLLLHDFVMFLGLGQQQRERILGGPATAFVDALLDERYVLPVAN